ncbi:MAG: TetR/AcrR family transcriptional regulator [Nocardioidaceae bacterium]
MAVGTGGRADARNRLIAAATRAFAEHGYHTTTTRDIAAEAGMSPAAVYVHHSSKEELLFLITQQGHDQALQVLRAAAPADADPVHRLQATVRAFTLWHADHHTAARVVQYELAALSPGHRRAIAVRRREIDQHMREVIADGVRRGVFDVPDVPGTSLALLSMAIDVARWYRDDRERTAESVADLYGDLAVRMVRTGATTGTATEATQGPGSTMAAPGP